MNIIVTGGAGFVGAALCRLFKREFPKARICAFDNLKRRGSEINLLDFKRTGIEFVHGDVRKPSDFDEVAGTFDFIIEASAEPSVHAGTDGKAPTYLLETNLSGTLNCLEFGRQKTGGMIFLSTSRVYSIRALKEILLAPTGARLELQPKQTLPGLDWEGMSETFPTVGYGARSLYGATKLASEIFAEEYAEQFNYPVITNRCGVIAGPGQFGKVDQGVFTLWVARHLFGGTLAYHGFGGEGFQVRDLMHPEDLFALINLQVGRLKDFKGQVFSVGGGRFGAVSLAEYTRLCETATSRKISIGQQPATAAVDVPYYVTNAQRVKDTFGWKPKKSPQDIVQDIASWLKSNTDTLKPLFT